MRISFKLSIILVILAFNFNVFASSAQYKQAFSYIKNKNWNEAEIAAKKLKNIALLKIVLSQKFLDHNYKSTDFAKITNFLKKNPKWPGNEALRVRAEGLIDDSTNKNQVYKWFQSNPPITGNGHKYYAIAAASVVKDLKILTPIIKNGWIYGCFSKDEQNKFLSKFKKYLTSEDTVNHIDNLLWRGKTTLAKQSLNLVNSGYKKSFEAQIAFLGTKTNVKKLFKSIPKQYYTQGLIYRYINLRKSELPSSKEIVALVNLVKNSKGHEHEFWKIQCYLAREYIQNKRFNDAYIIASNHFAKSPADASDAEFLSGWLALSFLKKPELAIKHFKNFNDIVKTPISLSRGLYWLGRAYAALGQNQEAQKLYQHAAHKFGYTFYGQVATLELGEKKLRLPPKITLANHRNDAITKNHDILKATKLVSKYGSNGLAQIYLTSLVNSSEIDQEILAIALEMRESKLHHRVWLSKKALEKKIFIDHLAFPTPYKTKNLPTEEALTYSIIRQESVFDQYAKSGANAMGLMQLVKPTACETSKKIGLKCNVKALTGNPDYNVQLGSHYIAETIQKYKNSYILAIISYNAGSARVSKWINLYSDPRLLKDIHKIIDWIELIPFYETRNYVQRVLENLQVYRAIIHKDSNLKLKEDLTKG